MEAAQGGDPDTSGKVDGLKRDPRDPFEGELVNAPGWGCKPESPKIPSPQLQPRTGGRPSSHVTSRHFAVGKRRGQGFRPSDLSDTVSRAAFALSRPSFATLCRPCGKQMFSDIRPTRKGCVLASRGPQYSSITWRIRSCPQMLLSVPESTSTLRKRRPPCLRRWG